MRIRFVNPPPGHLEVIGGLPEGAEVAGEGPADLLLAFAGDRAALEAVGPQLEQVAGEQLLWVAYPKGGVRKGTDLNRDILQELLQRRGLVGVSLVALDERWSALRVRRP